MRPQIFPFSRLDAIKKMSFHSRDNIYEAAREAIENFCFDGGSFFVAKVEDPVISAVNDDAYKECYLFMAGWHVNYIILSAFACYADGYINTYAVSDKYMAKEIMDPKTLSSWTRNVAQAFSMCNISELAMFEKCLNRRFPKFKEIFRKGR